ncbi:MAG: hypothetical protein ACJAYU_002376 [Bradymonadia bacterium]|jgi:hypothetical protein
MEIEEEGYQVPGATWVSGLRAPFSIDSLAAWNEAEPRRQHLEDRRLRYGDPVPSRTTMLYQGAPELARPQFASPVGPLYFEEGVETAYYLHEFDVADPAEFVSLQVELEFAAGIVVYVNGREIERYNVAPGLEGHGNVGLITWMAAHINQTMYRRWQRTTLGIDAGVLRAGSNMLAIATYKRPHGGTRAHYLDLRLEAHREAGFTKTSYLQRVEANQITVMWETNVVGFGVVEFGTSAETLDRRAYSPQLADSHHEVVLTGLQSDTRYWYQVRTEQLGGAPDLVGDVRSFRTAVESGTSFTFMAYGDNRTQSEIHTRLINRMWQDAHDEDVRFLVSTGDLVTNASPWEEWQTEFFEPALPLMGDIPYYTALGNHEGNHESYYYYLDLPGNESWYSVEYGDLELFAINSSALYDATSPQGQWLDAALAASTATWKVVFFHHPPYACTPARKPGDLGIQEHVVPVLERHGVQLALLGHDHLYGRSRTLNGVTYVITGGGGAPQYPSEPDEINEICRTEYHYCIVDVEPSELRLRAIGIDGDMIDDFTLQP